MNELNKQINQLTTIFQKIASVKKWKFDDKRLQTKSTLLISYNEKLKEVHINIKKSFYLTKMMITMN